jgi:hypothetical protein
VLFRSPLFDGIRKYQKDAALKVDGYMLPQGETEQSVNKSLARKGGSGDDDLGGGDCAGPAVSPGPRPWDFFRRRDYCPIPRDEPTEEDCEQQALDDERTCRRIEERYGAYRAQRCWASVQPRYGYCKHHKKLGHPPLDTGMY